MKYEMIFGDEGLFFDAQQDCEMVGNGHHKVENGKLMVWNFSEKYWSESHTDKITIQAMRRIIKEPNRWTLEDKKAGALPEVGTQCKDRSFLFKVINVTAKYVVIETMQSGDVYSLPHHSFMSSCEPTETPAEKAQREEDEFVDVIVSEYNKMPSSISFKAGIRAAYRKLKWGE